MVGIPSRSDNRSHAIATTGVAGASPITSTQRTANDGGVLPAVGFGFLLIFLFLAYSRLSDLFLGQLRLPLLLSVVALLTLIFSGGVLRAFSSGAGQWLTAFTIWLVVTVPFSFWPGGSVQLLTENWAKSFLVFVVVGGLLQSVKQCQAAMYALGFAVVMITVLCFIYGTNALAGRLALQQGILANPNDLAQLLLLGLPFLWLVGMNSSTPARAFVGASTIGVLLVTLKTGSRGGLVGLCALFSMMLLTSTWSRRIQLLVALIIAISLVLPFVSHEQLARYSTLLSSEDVDTLDDAVGSKAARLQLLRESVALTFSHPLVGIGPGMFQAAQAEISVRNGERGIWHESHNTYTQVSSETGLPGFAFYLMALVTCMKTSRSIHTSSRDRDGAAGIANSSYCLWLSLIVFAVTTFFSSVAYHMYFPMLAGLTVSLKRSVTAENTGARVTGGRLGRRMAVISSSASPIRSQVI